MASILENNLKKFAFDKVQKSLTPARIKKKLPAPQRCEAQENDQTLFGRVRGFLGDAKKKVEAVAIDLFVIDDNMRKRDENIFQSILYPSHSSSTLIQENLAPFYDLIWKIIPADMAEWLQMKTSSGNPLIYELLLRMIANMALQQLPNDAFRNLAIQGKPLPDYRLTYGELTENIFFQLISQIGPDLNEIDREIAQLKPHDPISSDLFLTLASHLLNTVLPPGDALRKVISRYEEQLINEMAKNFCKAYKPVSSWFEKRAAVEPETDSESEIGSQEEVSLYQENLDHFIPLMLDKASDYFIQKDQKFFKKMTSGNDYEQIAAQVVPLLYSHLPKSISETLNVDDTILKKFLYALVLRGSFYLTKQIAWIDKISADDLIRKVLSHLSEQIKEAFRSIKNISGLIEVKHFYPYVRRLISLFLPKFGIGFEKSWLDHFVERRQTKLLEPLAEMCFSIYNASANKKSIRDKKNYLQNLLWDRRAIKESRTFIKRPIPKKPTEKDFEDAGITGLVDQIYNFCYNLTSKLQEIGSDLITNEEKLDELLKSLPDDAKKIVTTTITRVFKKENDNIKWVGKRLHSIGHVVLFSALINFLENVAPENRHSYGLWLFKAFESLLEWGVVHLPKAMGKASGSKKKLAKALDVPIGNLFNIFFAGKTNGRLGNHLPIPKNLQLKAEKIIKKQIAEAMASLLIKITSWISDRKSSEDQILKLFESDSLIKFCNLIGHMGAQGIPYYFREHHEKTVKETLPFIIPFLSNQKLKPVNQDHPLLQSLLSSFLSHAGESSSKEMRESMLFIGEFIETILMRFVADFFERIKISEDQNIKAGNPTSVLENITQSVIKETAQHFEAIGETKRAVKKRNPNRADFLNVFHNLGHLHKSLNDELIKNPSGQQSDSAFLLSAAKKTLDLLGVNKDREIPIPRSLKIDFLNAVEKRILPSLLGVFCSKISDVATINEMLISILMLIFDLVSQDIDKKPIYKQLFSKNRPIDSSDPFTDEYQKELEKSIAKTVEAFAKMQQNRFAKLLIKSEKLKEAVGVALGQLLRGQINLKSILPLVDVIIQLFVDENAPSHWDPATRSFTYYAINIDQSTFKIHIRKDGSENPIKISAPSLNHWYPKGDEQKISAKAFEAKRRRLAETNIPLFMRKIIDVQTDRIAIDAFLKAWQRFEEALRIRLMKSFGNEYGEKIFKCLRPIIRAIKYPISVLVFIFNYTIWSIISPVLKALLNKQAKRGVEDVSMDILDNLVRRLLDVILGQYAEDLDGVEKENSTPSTTDQDEESHSLTEAIVSEESLCIA